MVSKSIDAGHKEAKDGGIYLAFWVELSLAAWGMTYRFHWVVLKGTSPESVYFRSAWQRPRLR
jgi:hypothetical protein